MAAAAAAPQHIASNEAVEQTPPLAQQAATEGSAARPPAKGLAAARGACCPGSVGPDPSAQQHGGLQRQAGERAGPPCRASPRHSAYPSTPLLLRGTQGLFSFVLLCWNVWCMGVELEARMAAISRILEEMRPDVVLLQEVTLEIYLLLNSGTCPGTRNYRFQTHPLKGNAGPWQGPMEYIVVDLGGTKMALGTVHLDHSEEKEKYEVLGHSLKFLDRLNKRSTILGGDFNWRSEAGGKERPMRLREGWKDAWASLRPGHLGYTFDEELVPIKGSRRCRARYDRVVCRPTDWEPVAVELVGQKALPGLTHKWDGKTCRVWASDHLGLLVEFVRRKG